MLKTSNDKTVHNNTCFNKQLVKVLCQKLQLEE